MDQELIAYLDARFRETNQQIASLREETGQRFEQVDRRFEQIDQRFEQVDRRFEQIDRRFEQIDQRFDQVDRRFEQIDRRFEQIDQRFEKVEDSIHLTQVHVEALHGEVKLLAEGMVGLDERLESSKKELKDHIDWEENTTRGMIRQSQSDLDRRTSSLETWRQTRERDPMDMIREKYGRPASQ